MSTRTKTTAPKKPAAPRKAAEPGPKPASLGTAGKAAQPVPAAPPTPATAQAADDRARRGDLLDALAERSPMRRADLKVAMELVLEEMGKMLDAGDELVLPPLGKLSVKKRVAKPGGGDMLTVKLRRIPGGTPGGDGDASS
jgi:nucleoid DNA-binding protein